ncbi:MAG: protein-glutamate O-methyltransferase CheR [Myxococcota bacterium]
MSTAIAASERDLDYIRELVESRSAIVLEQDKDYLVNARLTPVAECNGLSSISELVSRLRGSHYGQLHAQVVEAMTTNETSFFRDVAPFDALREVVLPFIQEQRAITRTMKIWCAACSSGQEPYSVGISLREVLPDVDSWMVSIHCTDLSQKMVDRTNAGKYSQLEVNRGLPAPFILKYFQKKGMKYVARDEIRRLVKAQTMNLIEPWPPFGPFDVIFLRNVLIYFNTDIKAKILERAQRALRPGGFLFLGGAETTLGICDAFERVPRAKASLYRLRS